MQMMEPNPPSMTTPQLRQEESPPMVVPNFTSSPLQVLSQPYLSVTQTGSVQNLEVTQSVEDLEETLALTRETRSKITMLKEIKVLLFKERYVKKCILICLPINRYKNPNQ